MSTTNTCKCYTRKTKKVCGNPAEMISVVWKGSEIYLPLKNRTGGYLAAEAAVCKMHLNNSLSKGFALQYMTNTFTKENTMNTLPEGHTDDFIVCPECNGLSNSDPDWNCGNCGCVGIVPNNQYGGFDMDDAYHGRPPLDTNCGCVRDPNSGEISYCEDHYAAIMEDAPAENIKCHSCTDGKRYAGPIINGVPSSVFKCYCCAGKGYMTPKDVKRDEAYHNLHDGGPEAHAPKTLKAKEVLCGNCRKNGVEDPYHNTAAEVRACYMGVKKVEFDSTKTKKIKCGYCKEIHSTNAEVKACGEKGK